MKYDFGGIEEKWQNTWRKERVYEPDLNGAKRPFYNLMMFPYPSAEGLHVGNMYAFVGSDIYGRMKRMQGYDVFEPIGLDGFGIHSENYALKIGAHPMERAKVSEKRFYDQLARIGNGFAWDERLETYDAAYYAWTQWLFVQMFKHGLAYRKKQAVNWCPSCKTVLSDEQSEGGKCERCGERVDKKELEQWFFRITKYAERLLQNLDKLDWSEKVKLAQKNWIGKSEGAEIDFEIRTNEKPNYLILHGYTGSPQESKYPWMKKELERRGCKVAIPKLPHTDNPSEREQVDYVLQHFTLDKNTVLFGHSLGAVVAMKVLQKANKHIRKLVLVATALDPKFSKVKRPYWENFNWNFDFKKIDKLVSDKVVISDLDEPHRAEYLRYLSGKLSARLVEERSVKRHFTGPTEPAILDNLTNSIKVFTTRPDTLFGATYMVVSPEHGLIAYGLSHIANRKEVEKYVSRAKRRTDEERIAEGREKTGIELKGLKAVNPANGEEIPVFVADYVLASYGTGAIMAVPAHDERDYAFAKKRKLPVRMVICSHYPAKTCPVLDAAYTGGGHLVDSGTFSGTPAEKAKWRIAKFVGGRRKTQFRLRDWLISRQRYWGPPIPMLHCGACARVGKGEKTDMPGWYAVPEKDLPVELPFVKDFRPKGTGVSPLAAHREFYEAECPKCGGKARRETDVSDTFLDSAWYYLRYPSPALADRPWDPARMKKWLPVDLYTGGAEHAVLHLLYVRFVALALRDMKLLTFGGSSAPAGEPFPRFRAHGLLIREGAKMSKSKGNVVNPDEYIEKFGADTLRMYLMFLAPFEQGGDFRDAGILGVERFLNRIGRYFGDKRGTTSREKKDAPDVIRLLHRTIQKVTDDIDNLHYNTAVSALMILFNDLEKRTTVSLATRQAFLKLLAPFAPHIAEEIWRETWGNKTSIHRESWPGYDAKRLAAGTFTLVIQVNGRVRDSVEVSADIAEKGACEVALGREKVKSYLGGRGPKRVIYVAGRLINVVT